MKITEMKDAWSSNMKRLCVGESYGCRVEVWASRDNEGAAPTSVLEVYSSSNGRDFGSSMGIMLTPDEMRELAKHLLEVARHAEQIATHRESEVGHAE